METKAEREARGQPVGRAVPYTAMGGLTSFSSLLDGYLSLEATCSGESFSDHVYVVVNKNWSAFIQNVKQFMLLAVMWKKKHQLPARSSFDFWSRCLWWQPASDWEHRQFPLERRKVPVRVLWGQHRAAQRQLQNNVCRARCVQDLCAHISPVGYL